MAKFVALFGSVSSKQLSVLKKAGFTGLTTDAQGELETREAVKKAGFTTIIRPAAWNVLDHALSEPTTGVGRDGNPREYNRNGGYTRDALVVAECYCVVLGSGLPPARKELILKVAGDYGRPVRELEEPVVEAPYDPVKAAEELANLPF